MDVCERAGLIAQSIQAISARAIVLALAGKDDPAREAAAEAAELAGRLHYPVGHASALEAQGATAEDPAETVWLLGEAHEAWAGLGRPLEAARCHLLAGLLLRERDADAAHEALGQAAEALSDLGVPHLTASAQEHAAT